MYVKHTRVVVSVCVCNKGGWGEITELMLTRRANKIHVGVFINERIFECVEIYCSSGDQDFIMDTGSHEARLACCPNVQQ